MRGNDVVIGLMVVVFWGLNWIAIKTGLQNVSPLLLGTLRFFFTCIPIIFFLPRPPVSWGWLIALGMTMNVGQFAFLFLGMKIGMPAGLASLIAQSQAFFTLAIAVAVLNERWHWNHILGLILAACGMAIIGYHQEGDVTTLGFILTLVAAACWSIGNIITRKATQGVPPFSMLALVVWSSAIAVPPLMLLSWAIEGSAAWQQAWFSSNLTTAAAVAYLAYFATLGGYGLWSKLLSRYPASVVSPFSLLVPVIGMSSSVFFLGETLSLWQMAGATLVMAGLVVHVFGERLDEYKAKVLQKVLDMN